MKIFEIRILLVLAIFFLLSSCSFTQDVVWGIRIDNGEVIKDLMINEEGTKLVLHGKKYHYFLNDDSKKIQKLFLWEARDKLIVNTTSIRTWGTRVRVVIYFEGYTKNLSEKQTEFLKKLGGRLTSKGKKIWIPGGFELMGNRYASESKSPENSLKGFISTGFIKKSYKEAIFEDNTPLDITKKILLTPFGIVVDVVMAPFYLVGYILAGIGSN